MQPKKCHDVLKVRFDFRCDSDLLTQLRQRTYILVCVSRSIDTGTGLSLPLVRKELLDARFER